MSWEVRMSCILWQSQLTSELFFFVKHFFQNNFIDKAFFFRISQIMKLKKK